MGLRFLCDLGDQTMTDIVPRLREHVRATPARISGVGLIAEAANEIERLREALRQFADCELHDGNCASLDVAAKRIRAIARAALREGNP